MQTTIQALFVEAIPMARQLICRHTEALGGVPSIGESVTTDNGNSIIDVAGLSFLAPATLETSLNQLPGAVCNGVFARRRPDVCITAGTDGISVQTLGTKDLLLPDSRLL